MRAIRLPVVLVSIVINHEGELALKKAFNSGEKREALTGGVSGNAIIFTAIPVSL